MKRQRYRSIVFVLVSLALLFTLVGGTWEKASAQWWIPTFDIVSVNVDSSVTIRTHNFPANENFDVRMNVIGTHGINGYLVQTINSGAGGTFEATYTLPAELKGQRQVAIRLENLFSGYYAYNWFWNNTTSGVPVTGPSLPPGVIPTFFITAVAADQTVTIQTYNFPANDSFDVRMNGMGTHGRGGYLVQTISSGAGGSFTATYNIPAELRGQRQIAIRLESPSSGYFAYNWFWNNTVSGVPVTGPVYPGVLPTLTMVAVTRDSTVTVDLNNFPPNDSFDVYMGQFGTQGVNGTKVDTVATGAGGSLTKTFTIPNGLKGQDQIAVRLQSPTSGYYTFNWFWNFTYP